MFNPVNPDRQDAAPRPGTNDVASQDKIILYLSRNGEIPIHKTITKIGDQKLWTLKVGKQKVDYDGPGDCMLLLYGVMGMGYSSEIVHVYMTSSTRLPQYCA